MTRAALIALTVALGAAYVWHSRAEIDRLRRSEALAKQNYAAVEETLSTVVNEKGEIEASRAAWVLKADELEDKNADLSNRLRRISGELNSALSIIARVESADTTRLHSVPTATDSSESIAWTYDPPLPEGNRLLIEGRCTWASDSLWAEVTRHIVQADIIAAFRERETGIYEAVASSTWPGLVPEVEGAILRPDMVLPPKKRSRLLPFGIGVAVGIVTWEFAR